MLEKHLVIIVDYGGKVSYRNSFNFAIAASQK